MPFIHPEHGAYRTINGKLFAGMALIALISACTSARNLNCFHAGD
jgi:hypothetical protein